MLEPVPLAEAASGLAASGTPDQAAPDRTNRDPLVTSQSRDLLASRACGFQCAYSLVTSRSGPVVAGSKSLRGWCVAHAMPAAAVARSAAAGMANRRLSMVTPLR